MQLWYHKPETELSQDKYLGSYRSEAKQNVESQHLICARESQPLKVENTSEGSS